MRETLINLKAKATLVGLLAAPAVFVLIEAAGRRTP